MIEKMIDHTILKADATTLDIIKLCKEAKKYKFKAVCVNPTHVELCKKELKNSEVLVCTVIGFPLGSNTTATKVFETKDAVANGADEIDMVLNINDLKSNNVSKLESEIRAVVVAASPSIVKVIIETALLDDSQIKVAGRAVKTAEAQFIKTSTGFSTAGAKSSHIKLMKDTVGNDIEVKASGGIRSYEDAKKMIDNGATRIGTSSGIKICKEESS